MTPERFDQICASIKPNERGCKIWPRLIKSKKPIPDNGYASVFIKGRGVVKASRLVLERKHGRPIRAGFEALHSCDNKRCINEDHVFEGTPKENTRDWMERNPKSFWRFQAAGVEAMKKRFEDPEYREKFRARLRDCMTPELLQIYQRNQSIAVEASKKKHRANYDPSRMSKWATNPVRGRIGWRIRGRRLEMDISQRELARAIGVSSSQVQHYENGKPVNALRISQIAKVLQCPIEYFLEPVTQDEADLAERAVVHE